MSHAEGEKNDREGTTEATEDQEKEEPPKGWHQVELTPYSPLLARLKELRKAVRQVQDATRAQIQKKEASQKESPSDRSRGVGESA